jgi:RimJ/RimL family protein N-acetyltransferase
MAAINADPEVMRWIRDGSVRDAEHTAKGIAFWEHEWETRGFGLFAVVERESGDLAGFTGLSVPSFLPEILPAVEIGWRLGRRFWGRGIATEAAWAALRFGMADCALDRIVSTHQIGNEASERIMLKLGMRPDREIVQTSCGRPVRVYEVTRSEFLRNSKC